MYFFFVAASLVVGADVAVDWLERLVSAVTYYNYIEWDGKAACDTKK